MTDGLYFVQSTPLRTFMDPIYTLHIYYRPIEDVHEEVWCWKIIFDNMTGFLTLSFLPKYEPKLMVDSAYIV